MRRRRTEHELATTALADRWRQTVEGTEASCEITNGAGISVTLAPVVERVELTDGIVLHVRLLPGQLPDDLVAVAPRLAEGMGVAACRVVPVRPGRVRVTLLLRDPLLTGDRVLRRPVQSALEPLVLGTGEDGTAVSVALGASAHLILAGSTGSGKSVGSYGLLSQLAVAEDVRVTGSDVSGLLLAPWAKRPEHGDVVLGTADPVAHVALFEHLVREMDHRITEIPPGRDAVELGTEVPVLLVVVEEYAGLLRLLDVTDKDLGKRARSALARLLAEGRKAGVRVLLIVQRAEAAIIGAYERSQASHRLSYRVDNRASVELLHPGADQAVADQHTVAAPGIALLSAPGVPLTRLRSPLCTYARYCDAVAGATDTDGPERGSAA